MMKHIQNLHTHSTYCDGRDTPEDTVKAAIARGFESIGFSGHSHMEFSPGIGMTPEKEIAYKQEVRRLAQQYAGVIDVFCGLEFEYFSQPDLTGYDYTIGSVHYLSAGEALRGFDRDAATAGRIVKESFGGDGLAYARAYYQLLADLPSRGRFDIIGHFDIISKHCEQANFFDETSREYLRLADDAAVALAGKIPFFEVNTGAIARGYRTTPYPSLPITKRLLELGFLPIISSDCHDKRNLDFAFDDAAAWLAAAGAEEYYILTKEGFQARALDEKTL